MTGPRADHDDAPYLTRALFLARTMSVAPTATLLRAKRERVFELLSRSTDGAADADFGGIKLQFALLAIADWRGSLPPRHRMSSTMIIGAQGRLADAFRTPQRAVSELTARLEASAPYEDPIMTERALRDEIIHQRSAANRDRRAI